MQHLRLRRFVSAAFVVAISLAVTHAQNGAAKLHRIAVFGSSVANGTGDELAKEATRDGCANCSRRADGKC
jgi:hypothetical protein